MKTICLFLGGVLLGEVALLAQAPSISILANAQWAQVSWAGGLLQSAPAVGGPWSVVAGAVSPRQVNKPLATTFYRVQKAHLVSVSKSGAGAGTIRSTTPGIDCGTDCSELVAEGATITLQAVAEAGSTFGNWTGDGSGAVDLQVLVNGPKSIGGLFNSAPTAGFVNSDFEQGPTVGWQQFPGQIIYTAAQLGVPAFSGQYMAWLGYSTDNRRLVQLAQTITLPNTTPLFVNFATWIYSEELCDVPYYDSMNIYAAGQRAVHWDVCGNNGSNTGGWVKAFIDVSAAAGQTITVMFEVSSADNLATIMLIDDVHVSSTGWR